MPAISSHKPYRIGRSRTGLGLFATRPIKKGKRIIRYSGPLLSSKKADELDNKYLFEINAKWTIDGSVRKNIARYVNHACRPNAESDVRSKKRKVFIRAIKNIEAGEEINYDYGTDYFKIFLKPIGCKCDACEKKRKKQRAEARAEKLRLKLRAEKKAAKADVKSKAAKKPIAKTVIAKSKPASAHARGSGKPTRTKAGRTRPLFASGQTRSPARKNRAS